MINQAKRQVKIAKKQADKFAALLGNRQNVLITTHISPDGDAVASCLGAYGLLRSLNSNPTCCFSDLPPDRYDFLPDFDKIISTDHRSAESFKTALILDCGKLPRIGKVERLLGQDPIIVNLDHHEDNEWFGRLNLIFPEAASTSEILFEVAKALKIQISEPVATCLYTGHFSDTGGFRYSNTDSRSLAVAAELAACGANAHQIATSIYSNNSPANLKMIGEAIASLELHAGGQVALMTVASPPNGDEAEDIIDYALSVRGVRAVALIRLRDSQIRVSLRGRDLVNVAGIARQFGGGGHPKAAGFTTEDDVTTLRAKIIDALSREVETRYADADSKD
ncbi:MAG: bifunctional oligoribonuclease/PAP phosphatase NrnA [bacterium]|nr:bifunctional oligoribonuclease/PAP phosphatase NrnA [bacterium]